MCWWGSISAGWHSSGLTSCAGWLVAMIKCFENHGLTSIWQKFEEKNLLSKSSCFQDFALDKLTFLADAFEATLLRGAYGFCKIIWITFLGSFLYFLKKSLTIPHQPALLQLSVDSRCSWCSWLSNGLQKCLCHLLQILHVSLLQRRQIIMLVFHESVCCW